MPGIEKILAVDWFAQEKLYYCGPAVAQMFLKHFGVAVSQDDLWSDIKANSNGSGSPNPPSANTDPDFPKQVCENCDGVSPPVWTCWNATPDALQKTVKGRTTKATLAVRYPSTFEAGVTKLIESIDRSPAVPPFATISSVNHWVVVAGYLRNDVTSTQFPVEQVGKYKLNGLYLLDPQNAGPTGSFKLVTVGAWHQQFGLIACASDPNLDRYPVVVGTDAKKKKKAWMIGGVSLVLALLFLWLWYSRT
jgi:Peptidase_C39 like family